MLPRRCNRFPDFLGNRRESDGQSSSRRRRDVDGERASRCPRTTAAGGRFLQPAMTPRRTVRKIRTWREGAEEEFLPRTEPKRSTTRGRRLPECSLRVCGRCRFVAEIGFFFVTQENCFFIFIKTFKCCENLLPVW